MRVFETGARYRYEFFGIVNTCDDQFAQHSHILKVDRPNHLAFINRIDMGDLCSDISCRVWTFHEVK